jgi:hypothetical protein
MLSGTLRFLFFFWHDWARLGTTRHDRAAEVGGSKPKSSPPEQLGMGWNASKTACFRRKIRAGMFCWCGEQTFRQDAERTGQKSQKPQSGSRIFRQDAESTLVGALANPNLLRSHSHFHLAFHPPFVRDLYNTRVNCGSQLRASHRDVPLVGESPAAAKAFQDFGSRHERAARAGRCSSSHFPHQSQGSMIGSRPRQ